jgi:hypothetical protein
MPAAAGIDESNMGSEGGRVEASEGVASGGKGEVSGRARSKSPVGKVGDGKLSIPDAKAAATAPPANVALDPNEVIATDPMEDPKSGTAKPMSIAISSEGTTASVCRLSQGCARACSGVSRLFEATISRFRIKSLAGKSKGGETTCQYYHSPDDPSSTSNLVPACNRHSSSSPVQFRCKNLVGQVSVPGVFLAQ